MSGWWLVKRGDGDRMAFPFVKAVVYDCSCAVMTANDVLLEEVRGYTTHPGEVVGWIRRGVLPPEGHLPARGRA